MRFAVRFLRYRGRILPWREVVNRPALVGDLRVEARMDEELRRYVKLARLADLFSVVSAGQQPELLDVTLVAMSPQAFTLSGFERDNGTEFAQSWLVAESR